MVDDLSTPYAAGSIAASAPDMVLLWRALLGGQLLHPDTTAGMFARLYPMFGQTHMFYGRGVIVYDLANVDPASRDVWLGHSGGAPGAKAVVAYSRQHDAFIAVALTGDGSAEATANLLLATLASAVAGL